MSRNIKISVLALIVNMFLFSAIDAKADEPEKKGVVENEGALSSEILIQDGNLNAAYSNITLQSMNAYALKSITVSVQGFGDVTDELLSDDTDGGGHTAVQYIRASSTTIGKLKCRLKDLVIKPALLDPKYYAKTITISVELGTIGIFVYKYDVIGAPDLIDGTGWTANDYYDAYVNGFCEGDPINVKIDNTLYPFGATPSELGHVFTASYQLQLLSGNGGGVIETQPGTEYTWTTITSGNSDVYTIIPQVSYTYDKFGDPSDPVSTSVFSLKKPYTGYAAQYDSHIDLKVNNGGAYVTSIFLCDGEESTVEIVAKKDGDFYNELDLDLYDISSGSPVLVESIVDGTMNDLKFTLDKNVYKAKDGKNTTYTFKLVAKDNFEEAVKSSCTSEQTFTVTVLEKSAQIVFSAPSEVCEDDDVNITATVTGQNIGTYTYQWSSDNAVLNAPGGLTSTSLTDEDVTKTPTTRNYTFTVSNQGCEVSKDVSVAVNPLPVLTPVDANPEVCYGGNLDIEVTSDIAVTMYTWDLVVADGNPTDNKQSLTNVAADQVYKVTATNDKGCTSKEATINVKVNPLPEITDVTVSDICAGGTASLLAQVESTYPAALRANLQYVWEWDEGSSHKTQTVTGGNPQLDITPSADFNGTISGTVKAVDTNNCESPTAFAFSFEVKTLPEINPSADPICVGENIVININPDAAGTYTYVVTPQSGAPAGTVSGDVYTVNSIGADGTYKYSIIATDPVTSCSSEEKIVDAVVNPLPEVTVSASETEICFGQKVTLTATNNSKYNYEWFLLGSSLGTGRELKNYEPTTTGTLTFEVVVTDKTTSCSKSFTIDITVNPVADATITPDKDNICEGETVTLDGGVTIGTNADYDFEWSTGDTDESITVTPTSTTTYKLVVTNKTTGCKSKEAEQTITVNKKPTFTMTASPAAVCDGEDAEVIFTPSNTALTYTWTPTATAVGDGTYKVSQTWSSSNNTFQVTANDGTCDSDPVDVIVTVNTKPVVNTVAPSATEVCTNSEITFTIDATGSNLEYELRDGSHNPVTTSSTNTISYTPTTDGAMTYFVIARDKTSGCESDEKQVDFTVKPIPTKPVATSDAPTPLCSTSGTPVNLSVETPETGVTYNWFKADNTPVGTGNSVAVTPLATTKYYVVGELDGCASEQSDLLEIKVTESPEIADNTGSLDKKLCESAKNPVEMKTISAISNLYYEWYWSEDGFATPVKEGTDVNSFKFPDDVTGITLAVKTYQIKVVAKNSEGCYSDEVIYSIKVFPKPDVAVTQLPDPICEGQEVTLGGTITIDSEYSDSAPVFDFYEDGSWLSSTTFIPKKSSTYSVAGQYKMKDATQYCSYEKEFTINFVDKPEFEFVGVTPVLCEGSDLSVTLSFSTAEAEVTSYKWYFEGAEITSAAGQNHLDLTGLTSADAGTYKLVVSNGSCDTEKTFDLAVSSKPTAEIVAPEKICVGSTAVEIKSAAAGTAYKWTIDGAEYPSTDQQFTYDASALTAGQKFTVGLVYTGAAGCVSDEVFKDVEVAPDFTADLTISSGDDKICEAEDVEFKVSSATQNIAKYTLIINGVEGASEELSPAVTDFTFNYNGAADDYTIAVKLESEYGCEFTTSTITPQVSHIKLDDITYDENICLGGSTDIIVTASGAVSDNYEYTFEIYGVGSPVTQSSNVFNFNLSTIGAYTVLVTARDIDADCSASNTIKIEVKDLPDNTVTIVNPDPTKLCSEEELQFSLNATKFKLSVDSNDFGTYEYDGSAWNNATVVDASLADLFNSFAVSGSTANVVVSFVDNTTHNIDITVVDPTTGCENVVPTFSYKFYDKITLTASAPYTITGGKLTLCLGNSVTITSTSADATSFDVEINGSSAATGVTSFTYNASVLTAGDDIKIIADNGCSETITIEVLAAPVPNVVFAKDVDGSFVDQPDGGSHEYEACSDQSVRFSGTGATKFDLTVTRDGNDASSEFSTLSWTSETFSDETSLVYDKTSATAAGHPEYSEYVFHYDVSVGECYDTYELTVKVYPLPEAELTVTPGVLVITGTLVNADVTTGYTQYDFFVNGTSVQSGSSNSYSFSITEDSNIKVVVYSDHGCTQTLEYDVKVLEGIVQKEVKTSSDYYCDNTDGVSISVVDPQAGITYELEGCATCAAIECDGSAVAWDDVKINGSNPTEFKVKAYYAALPTEFVYMSNSVVITEVKTPAVQKIQPYNITDTNCEVERQMKLDNSEVGVFYVVMLNGTTALTAEIEGNGGELDLGYTPKLIGEYTVVATSKYGLNNVCPVVMDGTYTIDVPAAQEFNLTATPDNGNFCEDTEGVTISLDGSEVGNTYYLLKNGDYIIPTPGDTVMIAGTGSSLTFDPVSEDGTYTISCKFSGCLSPMIGSVDIKKYAKPADQTFVVNNEGYYCEGDESVVFTVGGQEEGYLYTLYRDGAATSYTHTGDDSGTSFDFGPLAGAGNYTVGVTIPVVNDGCETILTTSIDVVEVKLPKDINMIIERDKICVGEVTKITIYNTEEGVTYDLYLDGTPLIAKVGTADNYIIFDNITDDGEYTVKANKEYTMPSSATSFCPITFDAKVELTVLARPATGLEGLSTEEPADKLASDPCYGKDIVVTNAQTDLIYKLYKLDEFGVELSAPSQEFTATGDVNTDRFTDIRDNNGKYRVYVSNGVCEDKLIPDVDVTNDKYVTIQTVLAETSMCHGELGKYVSLQAAEVGVRYTLFDPQGNEMDYYEAATTDGFTFITPMMSTGVYYVEGIKIGIANACPTRMAPDIDFKVNSLPVSYEIVGNDKYCAASTGVTLGLNGSEPGVNYSLYKEEGSSLILQASVTGTGFEVQFPGEFAEGVYVASARNYTTGCTSSMMGRVEVTYVAGINDLAIDSTMATCGEPAELALSSGLMNGVTYYVVEGDESPETKAAEMSVTYEGTPINLTFSKQGDYTVWASFDNYACATKMGDVHVSFNEINTYFVSSELACSGTGSVKLVSSDAGVKYTLNADPTSEKTGDGNEIVWEVSGTGVQTYEVVATNDICVVSQGSTTIDFDQTVVPTGKIDMYIQGEKYDSADTAQVCASTFVSFVVNVSNSNVKNYKFDMTGATPQTLASNVYTPSLEGKEGEVTLKVSIETVNGCTFEDIDSVTFKVMSAELPGMPLVAENNNPTYCSSEMGVKICYLNAQRGFTYRMYKVDDETGYPELMDIQEIPYYSTVASVDSLWMSGWGDDRTVESKAYAKAGKYYVEVEETNGCVAKSNVLEIFEVAAPVFADNKLYYALVDESNNIDEASKNERFGVLDSGSLVFDGARKGIEYQLIHEDNNATISTQWVETDGERIFFGVIPSAVEGDASTAKYGEGTYYVLATDTATSCSVTIGNVVFTEKQINNFNVSSSLDCDGTGSVILSGSEIGITYTVNSDPAYNTPGTGDELVWHFTGTGVQTYEVTAKNGASKEVSLGTTTIDYGQVAVPQTKLDMYIQGEKYAGTDTAEFCSSSLISFVVNVGNSNVKSYKYFINGVEESHNSTNTLMRNFEDAKSGVYQLKISLVTANGCQFDNVDSISFKVQSGEMTDAPLVAANNYPEYCEGDAGVRIAYLNAEKGYMYRMYRMLENNMVELMDIQEIPSYNTVAKVDSLWLNGWGNGKTTEYNAYAKAGKYYVDVEEPNGCVLRSNVLEIIENPLPVDTTTHVFYAFVSEETGVPVVDETTKSSEYGLLEAGRVVLDNAKVGITYQLLHIENNALLETRKANYDGQSLFFGPIKAIVELETDSTATTPQLENEEWGEGTYTILATNDETGCTSEVGYLDFVAEELVAYDVYIFLNKDEVSISKQLIPQYPNKGNHKFIDWSSKIDRAYTPKLTEEGMLSDIDAGIETFEKGSGYTSLPEKSNIVFELEPKYKTVVVNDTLYIPNYEQGCDSVYFMSKYNYFKQLSADPENGIPNDTIIYYPTRQEGCDSVKVDLYQYFTVGEHKEERVDDKAYYGKYGFLGSFSDPDRETANASNTGVFIYGKSPNFYGKEEFTYHIYNKNLKNVRRSNSAKIVVLCGNEAVGDSSTVFLIPNAFSPNGDGINDEFRILLPTIYEDNSVSSLQIFNRWGTLVYRSSGLQYGRDCPWWDGNSKTANMLTAGNQLPMGTYFYVFKIKFNDGTKVISRKFSGYVELRR